jgi:hypothetical protein
MTLETWLENSIGVAASLYLGVVLTGLFLLLCRRHRSRSRNRKHSQLAEPSAQFRAVVRFLERYRDEGSAFAKQMYDTPFAIRSAEPQGSGGPRRTGV